MFRSILLPMGESPLHAEAKEYAFWLARAERSHLHALAVIDIKAFEIPVLGTADGFMPSVVTPPIAESQSLLVEMTQAARERLDAFAGECASRGLLCSTDIRSGIPGELIAREAVSHDVIVMARSGYTRVSATEKLDPLVPQVIRGSIRPVLVAGSAPRSTDVLNLMVAFDGSTHAGRALTAAAALGTRPGVSCILMTVAASIEAGGDVLDPAETYLRHHGVRPRRLVVVGSRPSEIICEVVAREAVDLLIMGAFGHGPVREMIFGSTTQNVLLRCSTAAILQS